MGALRPPDHHLFATRRRAPSSSASRRRDAPERIADYWASVDQPGRSGLDDIAWSAAFISWDIESAGVPRDLFCPDQRHTIYVERMVERARRPGAAFIPHRPAERAPEVGDLICASREGSGTTLDNLNRGAGHCDIVVEVRPGEVHAIGGNVADSVSRSVFPLDGSRVFVAHIRPAVFAVIENRLPWRTSNVLAVRLHHHRRRLGRLRHGQSSGARMQLRILVLEAGPPDKSFMLKMPAGFASLGEKSPYNWRYETDAAEALQRPAHVLAARQDAGRLVARSTPCSTCAATPGTTTTGASSATRAGATTTCCRSSRRPRTTSAAPTTSTAPAGRSTSPTRATRQRSTRRFLEACEQAGHKRITDFNGAEQDGVGYYQVTQKNTASAGARPAPICGPALRAATNNVEVVTNALVERIILDGTRAMGVRYVSRRPRRGRALQPRDHPVRRRGELAAAPDAVGHRPGRSPAVARHPPVHDLPGVGGNLQDHLDAALLQFCKTSDTYDRGEQAVVAVPVLVNKKGPGTSPIAEVGRLPAHARRGSRAPDVQLHFLPVLVSITAAPSCKKNGYSLHVCTLRPESRGTIRLKSSDPKEHPLIDANYLAERRDLDTLIAGVKMGREIFAQSGLDPYRAEEFQPGAAVKTDAEIEQWIRAKCETIYHPVGTCKMGPTTTRWRWSTTSCRVHGVRGPARGRCLGDADAGRRQHQRARPS